MNQQPENRPGGRPAGTGWPRLRKAFRWFRIAALGVVLFAAAVVLWCNYVGVPDALAALLRAELRRKNLDVEFERLRLQGISHLVARGFRFASTASNDLPELQAASAEVLLDGAKLRRGELEVSGLRLQNGRLRIPMHRTNEPPRFLVVSNLAADLDLLPGDALRVTRVSADALGARAQASGLLRSLSRLSVKTGGQGRQAARWREQLREIADAIASFEFSEPPRVSLQISGDAARPESLRGSLSVVAKAARSERASFENLRLASGIFPARSNAAVSGSFSLAAQGVSWPRGTVAEVSLEAASTWTGGLDHLLTNSLSLSVRALDSSWGKAERAEAELATASAEGASLLRSQARVTVSGLEAQAHALGASEFQAQLEHANPFPTPAAWFRSFVRAGTASPLDASLRGAWSLSSTGVKLPQARLDSIALAGQIRASNLRPAQDRSLGFWRHVAPYDIPWTLAVSNILSEQIDIGSIRAAGSWRFPEFHVRELDAQLYRGSIAGAASLEVESRKLAAELQGDFDYHSIARLLDRPVQKWLAQFSWRVPPFVEAQVQLVAPAWTNSWARARAEILPALRVTGSFKGSAAFRDIALDRAESRFSFSNFVWRLPDLTIERPEGVTWADYTGNVTNGSFSCWIDARIDPTIFRSFAGKKAQPGFDLVRFPEPLLLAGQASGNWDRPQEIRFNGHAAATNFFVRERLVNGVAGEIALSNLVLEAWSVLGHLGTGVVRAPYLRMDIPQEIMFVTNVTSTANPYDAMYIVGPEAYDAIDPYRFAVPPAVRVNGNVPLRKVTKADLWFEVAGEQFKFWKFNLPHLAGTVHWRNNELWITNVSASFYRGRATWEGYFLIHDGEDRADFRFSGQARDADLKLLVADLFGMTNRMEGLFGGTLSITSADTANDKSWNGYGQADLRDGFLWSVPVFGVLTPMLDALVPGASLSKVTAGAGHFQITNSVIHTQDLQVRTRAFRLNYEGSVDLDGKLDALVAAEIFRDTWLVGRFFSLALWPVAKAFEAKISGNVTEPKTQLRYFPKFLLAPFKALGAIAGPKHPEEKPAPKETGERK